MSGNTTPDPTADSIDRQQPLQDPVRLREREDVTVTSETEEHDDFDHCCADIDGRVAVAVENDDGELLLMRNDELGIAVLPHGDVESGDGWYAAARDEIEALTGISIALDGIDVLREIDHVVDGDGKPHRTTYRIVFSGRPVGGEIQDCKQTPEAGSGNWWACWTDGLPDGIEIPPGDPGDDLQYVLG